MKGTVKKENRLPREVWVAGMSLKGLWPEKTIEKRMKDVLERMENFYAFEPDLICLPEKMSTSSVDESKTLEELAEDETTSGPITSMPGEGDRKQDCHITCASGTKKECRHDNRS